MSVSCNACPSVCATCCAECTSKFGDITKCKECKDKASREAMLNKEKSIRKAEKHVKSPVHCFCCNDKGYQALLSGERVVCKACSVSCPEAIWDKLPRFIPDGFHSS